MATKSSLRLGQRRESSPGLGPETIYKLHMKIQFYWSNMSSELWYMLGKVLGTQACLANGCHSFILLAMSKEIFNKEIKPKDTKAI